MYKSFKINATNCNQLKAKESTQTVSYIESFMEGIEQPNKIKEQLEGYLSKYDTNNDCIEAEILWDDWFPNISADVFISHSSRDSVVAENLAKYLKKNLGLKSFIDSEIWGHKDDLQRTLDKRHCPIPNSSTFDYDCRNQTTAHVNRILSHALTRMIDKTECFIFIESSNSTVNETNHINQKTLSPWIFHELSIAEIIKPRDLERECNFAKAASYKNLLIEARELNIAYPIADTNLTHISHETLKFIESKQKRKHDALDLLYTI